MSKTKYANSKSNKAYAQAADDDDNASSEVQLGAQEQVSGRGENAQATAASNVDASLMKRNEARGRAHRERARCVATQSA